MASWPGLSPLVIGRGWAGEGTGWLAQEPSAGFGGFGMG